MIELRPHQQKAKDMIRESMLRGNRCIMLGANTSFGKTALAADLMLGCQQKGKRGIFLMDRVKLVQQSIDMFQRAGLEFGVLQNTHELYDYSKPIQIATVQSVARRAKTYRLPEFDFAIVDEAHVHSKIVTTMMETYSAVPFIGLSATPYSKGLGKYYSDLIVPITPRELIDQEYLCPVRYYGGTSVNVSGVKSRALSTGGSDYHPQHLSDAVEKDKRLTGDIIRNWEKWGEGAQTVAFSPSIKHSKYLTEQFNAAGHSAEHIDGYMDDSQRQELYSAHDAGEFLILSCSRLLNTGWDSPGTRVCIDAFPTKSKIAWCQRVGRLMRTNPGKEYAIYLDHASNVKTHGFAEDIYPDSLDNGDKPFSESNQTKDKKEPKVKECPQCYQQMVGLRCSCGYEVPITERIETDDQILQEIKAAKKQNKEWTRQDKEKFLGELHLFARQKGYKPGWASNKYRERFSVWPNKINPAPAFAISPETQGWIKHSQIKYGKRRTA